MQPMGSPRVQHRDDWIAAKATIVATKKRLLPWKYGGAMDYPLPEYVVTFSYTVGGRALTGRYVTTSPQERGHTFNIFYDPEHPDRNTGLDEPVNPWVKWTARVLGIGTVIVAVWLWGDRDWFQY
jgi:hypothetical protein